MVTIWDITKLLSGSSIDYDLGMKLCHNQAYWTENIDIIQVCLRNKLFFAIISKRAFSHITSWLCQDCEKSYDLMS